MASISARHSIRPEETAVLVEGNFDVLSLHARGITNASWLRSERPSRSSRRSSLKRFAPDIVFLFDGDGAGQQAVRLSRDAIRTAGMSARVADLPNGVDPDELSRDKGERGVKDLLSRARGMLEALIEMTLDESFTQADAYEKRARIQFVAKLLSERRRSRRAGHGQGLHST